MTTKSLKYKSFNYIGSKTKLLPFISESIQNYTQKELKDITSFFDAFSGSGSVSYHLIQNGCKHIISNDIQHYAYIISSILTKQNIDLPKIINIVSSINHDNSILTNDTITNDKDFIYHNYTEGGNLKRMYFTKLNGLKIDRSRQKIQQLKNTNYINDTEYRLLLKLLLYAVTSISNTASVYGAYLKKYKTCALKPLMLDIELLNQLPDHHIKHNFYNQDINLLLDDIDSKNIEVCYIDSPYNTRSYNDNYHLLETISRYDYPQIKGKTGLRDDTSTKSNFCSKRNAKNEFNKILLKIKSKYIFISYSSESIVSKADMIDLLNINWTNIVCYEKEYQRFKSNTNCDQNKSVIEYLFAATLK
jgi:adenine-specific DNA-methyltransferase